MKLGYVRTSKERLVLWAVRSNFMNDSNLAAWSSMYVVSSLPPDTEETGAMSRAIESRQGKGL
jgi:hypothetical protein